MIEIPKPQSYDSLRKQLRGVVTDLLDRVRDQAANEAERRDIIDMYVAHATNGTTSFKSFVACASTV